jgi:hypothetical protein
LLLTKLISEIKPEIRFQESSLLGKDTSYDKRKKNGKKEKRKK